MIRMLLLVFVLRFVDGAMRRYEEGVRQKLADADSPHRW